MQPRTVNKMLRLSPSGSNGTLNRAPCRLNYVIQEFLSVGVNKLSGTGCSQIAIDDVTCCDNAAPTRSRVLRVPLSLLTLLVLCDRIMSGAFADFYPEPIWVKVTLLQHKARKIPLIALRQVEDNVKQYPRRIFDESPIFADMFDMPRPPNQANDGNTRENPLVLLDVPLEGFVNFAYAVEARYAGASIVAVHSSYSSSNHKYGLPSLNLKEWLDVLRLSDMWDMQTLRASAVAQLTKLFKDGHGDKALQLPSGIKYNVDSWKLAGLETLICRSHPLSAADCDLIGSPLSAFIMQQREIHIRKYFHETTVTPCPTHASLHATCRGCTESNKAQPIPTTTTYKNSDPSIAKEVCRLLGIAVISSAPAAPKSWASLLGARDLRNLGTAVNAGI
jgi:hypothetical protein